MPFSRSIRAGLAATLGLALAGAAPAADPNVLRIIPVDVEGGAGSLFITPQGHSLLIDTGFPAGMGGPRPDPNGPPPAPASSSAERIAAAAFAAGLKRIDYLLLSHYHLDHIGGAPELLKLIPIGTLIDHGPSRETPRRPRPRPRPPIRPARGTPRSWPPSAIGPTAS